jgi:dCMP deaminase
MAYVPVLHRGYLDLFRRVAGEVDLILVWDRDIIAVFDHLIRKDLRAVEPRLVVAGLLAAGLPVPVRLGNEHLIRQLATKGADIIMPDEPECHDLAKAFSLTVVRYEPVFLRWHRSNSVAENAVMADVELSFTDFDRKMMGKASGEAERSLDWWRQVGAVMVRGEEVILAAYNRHVPDERWPYVWGDPRASFRQGIAIEMSTAIHAEAALIAEAAKRGVALVGCSLYVTTFPCPPCAKLIGSSGVRRLYFQAGYSMLDGEEVMRANGIEIVRVV